MCLIIYATTPDAIARINGQHFSAAWGGNKDGAGIAVRYDESGPVTIRKGIMDLRQLHREWWRVIKLKPFELAIHFRYATHGANGPKNTHPFPLVHGAFLHNGILRVDSAGKESDTARFARLVRALPTASIRELLRSADILAGSRVLILDHVRRKNVMIGDWKPGYANGSPVPGLWLSQGYSVPALVKNETTYNYTWPATYRSGATQTPLAIPVSTQEWIPESEDDCPRDDVIPEHLVDAP